MRTPTQQTINEALAYVAITGSKKFLHIDTRIAISDYTIFTGADVGKPMYTVNEEGMALVRTTKFWKAHERIVAMGYVVRSDRTHRPSFVSYTHTEQAKTPSGLYWKVAFTSYRGDVYADVVQESGYYRPTLIEAEKLLSERRTTPAEVNRALVKAGIADVTMHRGREGYYYFDDATTAIASIPVHNLRGFSTQDIVKHVQSELTRIAGVA